MPITNSRSGVRNNNAYAIRLVVSSRISENYHFSHQLSVAAKYRIGTHHVNWDSWSSGFFHTPTPSKPFVCFSSIQNLHFCWSQSFEFQFSSIYEPFFEPLSFLSFSFIKLLMANWIWNWIRFSLSRDNLITSSSQPVPKPSFATAAKYTADRAMVSLHFLLECNPFYCETWIMTWNAIENTKNVELFVFLSSEVRDFAVDLLLKLKKHQQRPQQFTIICHNFLQFPLLISINSRRFFSEWFLLWWFFFACLSFNILLYLQCFFHLNTFPALFRRVAWGEAN